MSKEGVKQAVQSRWNRVQHLAGFGTIVVFFVLSLSLTVAGGRFQAAFGTHGLENAPKAQLSILLAFVSFGLIAQWYFVIQGELEMLKQYAYDFLPPLPDVRIHVFGISVLLPLLVYVSDRIILYAGLFAVFKLIEIWGGWLLTDRVRQGLAIARKETLVEDPRSRHLDALEQYYLRRPGLPLAVTWFGLTMLVFVISAYGELVDGALMRRSLIAVAYVLMVGVIVGNELIAWRWRKVRDRQLGEAY